MKRPTFPCDFARALGRSGEPPLPGGQSEDDALQTAAALEFEPINVSPADLPSNDEWVEMINPHLVSLRISAILLSKRKDELVEHIGEMRGKNELDEMIGGLTGLSELMKFYHQFAETALSRVLSAWAVAELRDGGE